MHESPESFTYNVQWRNRIHLETDCRSTNTYKATKQPLDHCCHKHQFSMAGSTAASKKKSFKRNLIDHKPCLLKNSKILSEWWTQLWKQENHNKYSPTNLKLYKCQISPEASLGILHQRTWRTRLFIASSDERGLYSTNSHYLSYTFLLKGLQECTFWAWQWKGNWSATWLRSPTRLWERHASLWGCGLKMLSCVLYGWTLKKKYQIGLPLSHPLNVWGLSVLSDFIEHPMSDLLSIKMSFLYKFSGWFCDQWLERWSSNYMLHCRLFFLTLNLPVYEKPRCWCCDCHMDILQSHNVQIEEITYTKQGQSAM